MALCYVYFRMLLLRWFIVEMPCSILSFSQYDVCWVRVRVIARVRVRVRVRGRGRVGLYSWGVVRIVNIPIAICSLCKYRIWWLTWKRQLLISFWTDLFQSITYYIMQLHGAYIYNVQTWWVRVRQFCSRGRPVAKCWYVLDNCLYWY